MKKYARFIIPALLIAIGMVYFTARSRSQNGWTLIVYPDGNDTRVQDMVMIPGPKSEMDCQDLSVQHTQGKPKAQVICTQDCKVIDLGNGERNLECKGIDMPESAKK